MPNPVLWLTDHAAILPLVIFCMRICDVSLDTLRMIFIMRGLRVLAVVFGFLAVLIWLAAISTVFKNLDKPLNMIAYAAGYAAGNWVGMWLENRLAIGQQIVQLISFDLEGRLAEGLRKMGFVVTELEGHGRDAPVKICFVATRRREVAALIRQATLLEPEVFVTVEDVRSVNRPLFRHAPGGLTPSTVARLS
jgi:uncharacterized protein YebE (UPF0316 family)